MEQMTLNLQQAKEEIKAEMAKTAQSFVIIGYRLRQILDSGAYAEDGYTDFNEFAKNEFGLSQSGTSRFISINKKYSEGGYGPVLREEYRGYSCSQLTEMLSLSSDDRELVSEGMPVLQIREVKEFMRGEDKSGQQSFIAATNVSEHDMYLNMFQKDPEQLRYLCETQEVTGKELCELINPTGSRVFKYKTIMMCMYEEEKGIRIRIFGGETTSKTYDELLESIRQQVTTEDIEELVNATSHIEKNVKEEEKKGEENKANGTNVESEEDAQKMGENPERARSEVSTEAENKNEKMENQSTELEVAESDEETSQVEKEVVRTPVEESDDSTEDCPPEPEVEKVEGEVVEEPQKILPETMRGYKAAISSQIRQLKNCLEDEDWERMKKIAEDIAWRAGTFLREEDQ